MNARIDAVLSYHMNPATCGVAKFNHRLAKELGVPCVQIGYNAVWSLRHPIVSIKPAEIDSLTWAWFPFPSCREFDVFLHGWDEHAAIVCRLADRVYAANSVIAAQAREHASDVIEAWCPSTIDGNPTRGTINVLTFGMAHKIQTTHYEKLKTLLDATGEDYTVSVSTAIHEGSPWDETALVGERLRGVFGERLRVLGYLADDALAKELRGATAVAMFFDPALRANNTTFWAAVDAKCRIVTNLDADSPTPKGPVRIEDINEMTEFSHYPFTQWTHGYPDYTWNGLKGLLQGQPCAK